MRPIATLLLVVAVWATGSAQVPVGKEPHHRVVFEDGLLRVLDVNIPPGTTTLDHSHDHDLITVSIGPADTRIRTPGSEWGGVRPRRALGDASVAEYAGKRGVHTIENVGPDPYHLIAVENVRLAGWRPTPVVAAAGGRPLVEGRAFRASALHLRPGQAALTRVHTVPSVVVLVSGEVLLTRTGREQEPLNPSTRWRVVSANEPISLSVPGGGPAHLVEIEVWQ